MRRFGLFVSFVLLLGGCGSGESHGVDEQKSSVARSHGIDDRYFDEQWYLHEDDLFYEDYNINPEASIHYGDSYRYAGEGVKIAIIDNGLDVKHPDLAGRIAATYSIVRDSSDVSPLKPEESHGTAVTGIIAADANSIGIKGIASESQIMFLQYDENMSDSETIKLFLKARDWGADIISNSWGTYHVSDAVRSVIVDLANHGRHGKGMIIVFATGNDNVDVGDDESSIPEVISVGATNKDNYRAWYSNYGANLDVLAPGGFLLGIATLDPLGAKGVATLDEDYNLAMDRASFRGTSAAAPIVTGVIAMMLEKNPNLTRKEVEELLHKESDKIGNLEYSHGFNLYYGYGKVNVEKLMSSI